MAFTDPNLSSAADKVVIAARPYLARLQRLGLDTSNVPVPAGHTIKLPRVNPGPAAQFDRSTNNYATASGDIDWVDTKLDNHPLSGVTIQPGVRQAAGDAVTARVDEASVQGAASAVTASGLVAFHGILPAADGTANARISLASHTSGLKMDEEDFATIRDAAVTDISASGGRPARKGVAPAFSALVLGSAAYSKAMTTFNVAAWTQRAGTTANPVVDGWFPGGLLGFRDVVEDPLIPSSIIGYVVPYDSFVFGARAVEVENPEAYPEWDYRFDPETGMPYTFRKLLIGATDDRKLNCETQFGAKMALPAQVLTILPHA